MHANEPLAAPEEPHRRRGSLPARAGDHWHMSSATATATAVLVGWARARVFPGATSTSRGQARNAPWRSHAPSRTPGAARSCARVAGCQDRRPSAGPATATTSGTRRPPARRPGLPRRSRRPAPSRHLGAHPPLRPGRRRLAISLPVAPRRRGRPGARRGAPPRTGRAGPGGPGCFSNLGSSPHPAKPRPEARQGTKADVMTTHAYKALLRRYNSCFRVSSGGWCPADAGLRLIVQRAASAVLTGRWRFPGRETRRIPPSGVS